MTNLKQKTREWLKKEYNAEFANVEFWNAHSKTSVDLFGLFDAIAIFNQTIYGIQITSFSNRAARHKKMMKNSHLFRWLDTKNSAWLISWKKAKRGGNAYIYLPRIREYVLSEGVVVWNDR